MLEPARWPRPVAAFVNDRLSRLEAACREKGDTKILAVTVLTSLDEGDLKDLGFAVNPAALVYSRAKRALALGWPVVLVEDAHTTEGNAHLSAPDVIRHHNLTLANISSFGPRVRVVPSADLQIAAHAARA